MEKVLIENDKLTPEMGRTRSGSTQLFRRKGLDRHFTNEKNADVILNHERKEMYAELIDGQWYWVSGCAECNGEPRSSKTYIECEKHNVCRKCKTPRKELKGSAWGGRGGWQCQTCKDIEHEAEKQAVLSAMPEEYDSWDFQEQEEIKCPYCAYEFSDSWEHANDSDEDHECPRCDNIFKVTAVTSLTFTSDRIDT